MSELIISEQHRQAVELHQKIMISANLAQQNLFEMCTGLKTMRDNKLYRELGYSNFEDYCENEVGFNRTQAHKYISIIENTSENVYSSKHLGVSKLYLLSTISEQEQQEISEKVNLESTTVKQLKAEIEKLKAEKSEKQSELSNAEYERDIFRSKNIALKNDIERLRDVKDQKEMLQQQLEAEKNKNSELENKVEELENRPIEVAVQESSDNERRLQETLKALERENIKHYDELEKQYREDEQAVRQMLEKEKQEALEQLKAEYEQKIAELKNNPTSTNDADVDKEAFLMCVSVANKMLERVKFYYEKHFGSKDYGWYAEKTSQLKQMLYDVDYPM